MFDAFQDSYQFLWSALVYYASALALIVGLMPMLSGCSALREAFARLARRHGRGSLRTAALVEPGVVPNSHLDPTLDRLLANTRTLVYDLRAVARRARSWPTDGGPRQSAVARIFSDSGADFGPLNYVTREVWNWVRDVESLSELDRRRLSDLGVESAKIREFLFADDDIVGRLDTMIGTLRSYQDRLTDAPTDPYRARGGASALDIRGPKPVRTRPRCKPITETGEHEATSPIVLEATYEEVVAQWGKSLQRVAWGYTRSRAEAEDLSQDISLAIWRALPRFQGKSSLRTYVFRIAHNRGITWSTRRKTVGAEVEVQDPSPCPETMLVEDRRRAQLLEAVLELPAGQRQVLTLRLEDLSYSEIAEVLGITETNVSVRLTRARQALRRRFAEVEAEPTRVAS